MFLAERPKTSRDVKDNSLWKRETAASVSDDRFPDSPPVGVGAAGPTPTTLP